MEEKDLEQQAEVISQEKGDQAEVNNPIERIVASKEERMRARQMAMENRLKGARPYNDEL